MAISNANGAGYGRYAADRWTTPRPPLDPGMRRMTYGPIQSMDEDRDSFWRWLFHRH